MLVCLSVSATSSLAFLSGGHGTRFGSLRRQIDYNDKCSGNIMRMLRKTMTATAGFSTTTTRTVLLEKKSTDSNDSSNMQRPILDQIATMLFKLENDRVESSSVMDEKRRYGEPMEWSEETSLANKFSQFIASNEIGYQFKQFVANIIAGNNYDIIETQKYIQEFINTNDVAMFSFTSCPFCRKAKDVFDERGIRYSVIELDELSENRGNEIRAELGKLTKRTSVPSIFIYQQYIGGCNDGNPGLIPLIASGEFDRIMKDNASK